MPLTAADIPALGNDPAAIRAAARALGRVGPPAITRTRLTINAWRGAAPAYEAPEAPALLAALEPTMPVAHRVFDRMAGAERALTGYADAAEPLIVELRRLLAAAASAPAAAAAEAEARIRQLVAELDAAERDCAAALQALAVAAPAAAGPAAAPAGLLPGGGLAAAGLPAPPAGAPPAEVRRWWESLGDQGRAAALAADPRLVGSLDGIPAVIRDQANRPLLAAEISAVAAQQRELEARIAELRGSAAPGAPAQLAAVQGELQAVAARLDSLNRIEDRLTVAPDPDNPDATAPAYLMGFQPHLDVGRAIVAIGNPDLAQNVVTQVPGLNTDLNDVPGDVGRVEAVYGAARELAPGQQTAVIAWLGYQPPVNLEVVNDSRAEGGVAPLRAFQDGLRVTHEGPRSLNTVIGHSFGSTVVGETASTGPLDADRIIAVGSPGMNVDHVSQLNRPPGTVYASRSDSDWIWWAGSTVHGPSPTVPSFGAEVFEADPDGGHSDYWREKDGRRNQALTSMGRIVTGQEP